MEEKSVTLVQLGTEIFYQMPVALSNHHHHHPRISSRRKSWNKMV